jgi:hypothetical protein
MDRNEIADLAKGMVPFVRECVIEALTLPPELVEEVARAVRLLHESPPLEQKSMPQMPPMRRIRRIERDEEGNFIPIWDETQS